MLPAVDVEDLSGDGGGGEEVEGGGAKVVEGGTVLQEKCPGFFMRVGRRQNGPGRDGVDADAGRKFNGGGKGELRKGGFGGGVNGGLRGVVDALVEEIYDDAVFGRGGVEGLHEGKRGKCVGLPQGEGFSGGGVGEGGG